MNSYSKLPDQSKQSHIPNRQELFPWLNHHEVKALHGIIKRNLTRWKYRLGSIALLIMISLTLMVLQGGSLLSTEQQRVASLQFSPTVYYDALVVPSASQSILTLRQLPTPMFQRQIYAHGEAATLLTVGTSLGQFQVLGINPQTLFFRQDNIAIENNVAEPNQALLQRGELILTTDEAKKLEVGEGDSIDLSYQAGHNLVIKTFMIARIANLSHPVGAVLCLDDLLSFNSNQRANNCYLVNYDRSQATLEHLVEWMSSAYPRATIYSDLAIAQLALNMQQQLNQVSNNILSLIIFFVFISVFTIVFVTFLERRQEFATLKSLRISQKQVSVVFIAENFLMAVVGLIGFHLIVMALTPLLPWLIHLDSGQLNLLYVSCHSLIISIMFIVLSYPLQLIRIASVNQLLFTRSIPLWSYQTSHMSSSYQDLLREEDEEVRLLKIPAYDGKLICICTKQEGDHVKLGEVIAAQEYYGGLYYREWVAPCNGVVVEISLDSGILVIKPVLSSNAPEQVPIRSSEQQQIVSEERRRMLRLEASRKRVRADLEGQKHRLEAEASSVHGTPLTFKNGIVLFLVIAFIGVALWITSQNTSYAAKWRSDLVYVKQVLPQKHPNLYFHMPEEEFLSRMDMLIASVTEVSSELSIIADLTRIINDLGDGHTSLAPLRTARGLAVQFFIFEEGVFAIDANVQYADLYGKQLTAINNIPIEQVFTRLIPYVSRENINNEKFNLGQAISNLYLLKLAGINDNDLRVTYTFGDESYVVSFDPDSYRATSLWLSDSTVDHLVLRRNLENYWYCLLDDQTMYVHYKRCEEMPNYTFERFVDDVFATIDNSLIERLIIDIRDNSGGDSRVFEPFVAAIAQRPQLNREDNLKVIVGRQTFSSGVFAILQLMAGTEAQFIGEPTGSAFSHFGYPDYFDLSQLPYRLYHSTLYFDYDFVYGENNGHPDAFYPDIACDLYASDWFAGIDAFITAALREK